MSTPRPQGEGLAVQILALAGDIKDLRTQLGDLSGIGEQVTDLADAVSAVEQRLAELAAVEKEQPVRMWDWTTMDKVQANTAWNTLVDWADAVLVRTYNVISAKGDADTIPACWYRHPAAVAELSWLCQEWHRIYRTSKGTPGAAGDWHDRWLPGIIKRLRTGAMRQCSNGFDGHQESTLGTVVDDPGALTAVVNADLSDRPLPPPKKK